MTTRSTNVTRNFMVSALDVEEDIPVIATDIIYEGSAVGESSTSGTGRPLVAGDNFMGFCVRQCDNASGAANDKKIRTRLQGYVELTITSVDNLNDEGSTVYASDDDTFTLASTGNSSIGKVVRVTDTTNNKAIVFFQSVSQRSI